PVTIRSAPRSCASPAALDGPRLGHWRRAIGGIAHGRRHLRVLLAPWPPGSQRLGSLRGPRFDPEFARRRSAARRALADGKGTRILETPARQQRAPSGPDLGTLQRVARRDPRSGRPREAPTPRG